MYVIKRDDSKFAFIFEKINFPIIGHVMKQFRVVLCVISAATLLGVVVACSNIFVRDSRTVTVSGNLAGSIGVASRSVQQSIEGADTVVAIPVSDDGICIDNIKRAREGSINEDGSFSIDIPVRNGSWIVLAIDSEATGFDRLVGHMVIDEDTARLHTLPIDNADEDLDLGTMSFDEDAQEFVAEHGMSAYAESMNLSVAELRDIARTDSMSKLAINLYVNYTLDDYWEIMTVWSFDGKLAQNLDGYADATNLSLIYGASTYTRFTWMTPTIPIDSLLTGATPVRIFPPEVFTVGGSTYGPDNPLTNTRLDNGSEEGRFAGGLIIAEDRNAIGFDIGSIVDPSEHTLISGVWRVEIGGEDRAWFDVQIGSPFDTENNLIALVPEPRLDFSNNSKLDRLDVRFMQQESPGSYGPADSAARGLIQWGQVQLFGKVANEIKMLDIVSDAAERDFVLTPDHPEVEYSWYRDENSLPSEAGDKDKVIEEVRIATRAYGEDFFFMFSRNQ